MSLEENLADLERHGREFAEHSRFAYTVLRQDRVVGCVYIEPVPYYGPTAKVKSWVSSDHAFLDRILHVEVATWLDESWPFHQVRYRPQGVLERRLVSFEAKPGAPAFRITVDGGPVGMTLTETETIVGNRGAGTRRLGPARAVDWLTSPKAPLTGWPDDAWIKVSPDDRSVRVDFSLPNAEGLGTTVWCRESLVLTFDAAFAHADVVWDHWNDVTA
ncbi:hypothetical protein [Actinocorallia libanotica]|uniref:Acetyltransferase (GNAT) family protein n=1 Tax=Actinocorallia libanotica TaxID=46162 RepID=A0ABP4C4F4_9ACTN